MYLLYQLLFCQWDIVIVGRSFYSLECFTTTPFVTYNQLFCGCLYRLKEGQHVQSFVIPCSRYANQNYSGGVAKEQIKHRQKKHNSNKTEMPEKIHALGNSTELRLEIKMRIRILKK